MTFARRDLAPVDLVRQALRGTDGAIAVTGATGWLGSAALDLLFAALGADAPARVVGYASSRREHRLADGRVVTVRPLDELVRQAPAPTTVLHFAYLTRDRVTATGADRFVALNLAITATVLEAIAVHRPHHLVAASSGAVYAQGGGLVWDVEADPYGALKRLDELALRTATRDVGGACVLPRVFSVAGGRPADPGRYALGDLIAMARAGGPIEVRARGPVVRSYIGVEETVALSLAVALAGRDAVFDTGGAAIEVGDLARLVARLHGRAEDSVVRTWDPDAPEDRYVGDGRAMDLLADELGLRLADLPELIARMSPAER